MKNRSSAVAAAALVCPLILSLIIAVTPTGLLHAQTPPGAGELTPSMSNGALDGTNMPQASMKSLQHIDPGTPLRPGDFPVTITERGSYYFTDDVLLDSSTVGAAIIVSASDVTIDLRGFSLVSTAASASSVTESAIYRSATGYTNILVRNGIINGPWYAGVYLNGIHNARCENLRVSRVDRYGIYVGDNSAVIACQVNATATANFIDLAGIEAGDGAVINGCTVAFCQGDGIKCGKRGTVQSCNVFDSGKEGFETEAGTVLDGCTAGNNSGPGFSAGDYCAFRGCVAYNSGSDGFIAGIATTFQGCVAGLNDNEGIETGDASQLTGCTAYDNGGDGVNAGLGSEIEACTATGNTDDGFRAQSGSTLRGCSARNNDGDGIDASSSVVVSQCSAYENGAIGITAYFGSSVTQCAALDNYNGGIIAANGSVIAMCSAELNGADAGGMPNQDGDGITIIGGKVVDCVAYANAGDGFYVGGYSLAEGNVSVGNAGAGMNINTDFPNVVRGNFSTNNTGVNYTAVGGNIGPIQLGSTATSPTANFQ